MDICPFMRLNNPLSLPWNFLGISTTIWQIRSNDVVVDAIKPRTSLLFFGAPFTAFDLHNRIIYEKSKYLADLENH